VGGVLEKFWRGEDVRVVGERRRRREGEEFVL
jgi:hypothetical protein